MDKDRGNTEKPETELADSERRLRALGLLRPVERAVMLLSAVEGYTAREIGELLDAPRGTVLSLMHRTRAKIRRWLTESLEPEVR